MPHTENLEDALRVSCVQALKSTLQSKVCTERGMMPLQGQKFLLRSRTVGRVVKGFASKCQGRLKTHLCQSYRASLYNSLTFETFPNWILYNIPYKIIPKILKSGEEWTKTLANVLLFNFKDVLACIWVESERTFKNGYQPKIASV